MMFQGQEFLEDQWWSDDRPLDWSKVDSRAGILRLYRDLIQLRRNFYDTTRGLSGDGMHLHHLNNDRQVARVPPLGSRAAPATTWSSSPTSAAEVYDSYRVGLPRPGRWRVRFNSDFIGYDFGFGNVPGYDTESDWISVGQRCRCRPRSASARTRS